MQETYTIKDAAKQVQVESHVLRYWEEELGLTIGRNELGHRCYTKEDVELMERIRQWKKQGMQLKAIRLMLSEDGKLSVLRRAPGQDRTAAEADMGTKEAEIAEAAGEEPGTAMAAKGQAEGLLSERESKAARLQYLLENLVSRAVQESNERVLKEIDYQFRLLEENAQAREQRQRDREEEHYKKLDELLCQRGRRREKRKKHSKF